MDSELQRIVDAVRAVETQLRETALGPARARHDAVPRADEEHLLGALAAVLEVLKDLSGVLPGRLHTPNARFVLNSASLELGGLAGNLRRAERHASAGGV
ncbi:hypothetical protein [Kitasatospora sp. KL5]|uniref:hypothetical protein n=1 Tax=Kitasatospora sp. KL5 TaxID=3425125 RepID=UPI003D6FBF3C